MNIIVFDKGDTFDITPTLALSELKCKCGYLDCTRTLVLRSSVESYTKTRDLFNAPIRFNSGFRCQKHNTDEGGNPNSYHMIGSAHDITPWDFDLDALDRLEVVARKHYDVVIRYGEFIHCHNFGDK